MSTGFPAEPGSREPGLDQLIRALTTDGYPHELAGRDAALAAFRAASRPLRLSLRLGRSVRLNTSARLGTMAAALVTAIAGVTAAAYAQALPAPVQHIAYSVLAPLGVPDSQPSASPAPAGAASKSAPGSANVGVPGTTSPSASCPCPTATSSHATAGAALTLNAGRAQLPAGGADVISGKLTYRGHPETGVRVRLLEQAAGVPGWQLAATGVTGGQGRVRFGALRLTRNTAFRLAVPGGPSSAQVSVTVLPRVLLWLVPGAAVDRLVASARFGDPGDTVVLQEKSGGVWQNVATRTLGAAHRAVFRVSAGASPGADYRVVLQATSTHGAGVSSAVRQPHGRPRIGAKAVVPATPQPLPTATSPAPHRARTAKVTSMLDPISR